MSRFLRNQPVSEASFETGPSDEIEQPISAGNDKKTGGCKRIVSGCARTLMLLAIGGAVLILIGVIGVFASYLYLSDELAGAIDQVTAYQGQGPGGTPRFYDRHGTLLFELKTAEKRRWLDYQEIPEHLVDATVAVEDDTFWANQGFDPEAIVAALISNYRNPGDRPAGASTITQQLVRHIAFSYEERVRPSYKRKVREVFLAFILTRRRNKQDIMTMYLNEIYYGNLAYGIEAAAQTYFAKPASILSLAEAAFLAGLPQAPYDLDPYNNYEAAKSRQEFVLSLMAEEGSITFETAESAKEKVITLAPLIPVEYDADTELLEAPHFVLYVQNQLEKRYGPEALIRGGWQIQTTLDLNLQKFAEQAAREWVAARAGQHDVDNASIVVLKPGTGEILAMVGSLNYFDDEIDGQVNVSLQPRQPGSSIKPITYAAAMERGWTTGDVIWDVPIELNQGNGQKLIPKNYDNRYHGPVLLRDALANSYNIPPIQLIRDIGIPSFISTGRKMGIQSLTESPGYYGLVLTLGGGEVPLLEMTHAYATLSNMGQRPHLTGLLQITDSRDRFVYELRQDRLPAVNAVDPRIAYIITDILDDDAARAPAMGRNNSLALPFPAAAKTGTTNDFRDNWTLGYTPGVVVGVWVGNTDGHPMRNSSGLRGAAPLWRTIMEHIYADETIKNELTSWGVEPATEFNMVPGINEQEVCVPRGTGGGSCTSKRTDLFLHGGPIHGVQRLGYVPDTITNPGAWTLAVAPLSNADAQQAQQQPQEAGVQAPIQTVCVINMARPPANVSRMLLLPVPPFYPDEIRARRWAQQNGYQMAPSVVCPQSVARTALDQGSSAESGNDAPAPVSAEWRITSPLPGEQVTGLVPIMGTANFDSSEVQYYKLEIGSGVSPSSWTTFGTTHNQGVVNGVLENLQANALPPGQYVIRLIIVGNDGNFPSPFSVPITIVP